MGKPEPTSYVWVATMSTDYGGSDVLGVAASAARAVAICEEHWSRNYSSVQLSWDTSPCGLRMSARARDQFDLDVQRYEVEP